MYFNEIFMFLFNFDKIKKSVNTFRQNVFYKQKTYLKNINAKSQLKKANKYK